VAAINLPRRSHLAAAGKREELMDPGRKAKRPKAMPQPPDAAAVRG
jgi:hypothetical protein